MKKCNNNLSILYNEINDQHRLILRGILLCSVIILISIRPAYSQSWEQNGTTYTYNSTSAITGAVPSLSLPPQTSGVQSYNAIISSSNNTTATASLVGNPSSYPNPSMFRVFSFGSSDIPNASSIVFNNSANVTYSLSSSNYVNGSPPKTFAAPPVYGTGPGSLFSIMSMGFSPTNIADGSLTTAQASGGNGGDVTVDLSSSAWKKPILLQLTGPTSASSASISANDTGVLWQPSAAIINARSVGGTAVAQENQGQSSSAGNGGNGGSVTVTTSAETILQVGNSQNPVNGHVAAISAVSQGAPGAVCCTYDSNDGFYQLSMNSGTFGALNDVTLAGTNGSGSAVIVENSAFIDASGNKLSTGQYGGGIIGINAVSIGGAVQFNPNLVFDTGQQSMGVANPVGASGDVSIKNAGIINLPGQNSIGILASSIQEQTIISPRYLMTGTTNSSGNVDVNLSKSSIIITGNNQDNTSTVLQKNMSGGVLAVSSTGWLVNPFNSGSNSNVNSGNGGAVTVSNAGSIFSYGHVGFGIAALSIGNSGQVTNNGNSTQVTNVGSGVSSNGYNAAGGSSTVTNDGIITTAGSSSIAILAAANGSGGLVANDLNPSFSGPISTNNYGIQLSGLASGIILGNASDSAYVSNGGSVYVTNKGAIYSGIKGGGGEASIGILAQSVGGGGGSIGGSGTLAFAGDAGGAGGAGGSVSVSNYGFLTTLNDGSIGILAQSVGGGGGNGGNASGIFASVGGQGGAGGSGGSVNIINGNEKSDLPSSIITSGDYASGIVGQSVGGGGGNGGYSKSAGIFVAVGVGGAGGSGGNGGLISFTNQGNQKSIIETSGDQSHGVLLQSIGGGGGMGGGASSYSANVAFSTSIAVGGQGGMGGNGGSVGAASLPINNLGHIQSIGNDSIGFLMQSIGGGGGNGGTTLAKTLAISVPDVPTINFATSIGGIGGSGGDGGAIYFSNNGYISTIGSNSLGVVAQSIGGGGGNGGDASAGANVYGKATVTLNESISVGGAGSVGGVGGSIDFSNLGAIETGGNNSTSLLVQSVGGGGGTGGIGNSTETRVSESNYTFNQALAIGGTGGAAGSGGDVTLSNTAKIKSIGSSSSGIVAQAIGGGGGIGASAGAQGIANGASGKITVGGNGGGGGNSGNVTVTNNGLIETGILLSNETRNPVAVGGDSHGIVAQSIAGGGGIGGSSDPDANLISNPFVAATKGLKGYLLANELYQFYKTPSITTFPAEYEATIAVGGKGGGAGTANTVSVQNSGSIGTIGHRSFGIMAQSIGGGGGYGASVMSGASDVGSSLSGGVGLGATTGLSFNSAINVGGNGGASGAGGIVNINQTGNIKTFGYGSFGVLAQSIGGGGGYGADGSIVANSGWTGSATWNDGVSGGFSIGLGQTNSTPSTGSGGTINYGTQSLPTTGSIATYGDHATAILAQSIGSGGGVGSAGCTNNGTSANASACLANTLQISETTTPAMFVNVGQAMTLAINPAATTPNIQNVSNGGVVNIFSGEKINTFGDGSFGIAAQSIGAGGGFILANSQNISGTPTLPLMGVGSGTGGTINITANGLISTAGAGAYGIMAQSIGGGGGFIGDPNFSLSGPVPTNFNLTLQTLPSNISNGGDVNVTLNGSIYTAGPNSHGIFVQSIGGGGGVAAINGVFSTQNASAGSGSVIGLGGAINISVGSNGSINALGAGSVGIFAQSQGNYYCGEAAFLTPAACIPYNPGTPISITVNGSVNANTGIIVAGGTLENEIDLIPNTIVVNSGGSVQAPKGQNAIISTNGTTNVTNYGIVSGGLQLAATENVPIPNGGGLYTNYGPGGTFKNYGTYNATGVVTVSNNSLRNYGTVNVAGAGVIGNTDVFGSYKQYSSGITNFDTNTTEKRNDFLRVAVSNTSSGTMLADGAFHINRLDSYRIPARGSTLNIVSAEGGFLPNSKGIAAPNVTLTDNSPLVKWQLLQNGNSLSVTPTLTSLPTGVFLSRNQQGFINYLASSYNNGDSGAQYAVGKLVSNGASANLNSAIDSTIGTALNIQKQTIIMTGNSMLGNALNCHTIGYTDFSINGPDCVWSKFSGGQLKQSSSDVNSGYLVNDLTYSTGAQSRITKDTIIGGSVRVGETFSRSTNFFANANVGDISLGIKKEIGNYSAGLSGAFGLSSQFNNRYTNDFYSPTNYNMTSRSNIFYSGAKLRNSYQFKLPNNTYIQPYLDLDGLWTWSPAFSENGLITGVPLNYRLRNNGYFIASPMLEFGGSMKIPDNTNATLRPYFSAGMMFVPNNNFNFAGSIIGANSGSFDIISKAPNSLFRINAGVQLFSGEKIDLKIEYSGMFSNSFIGQFGTAKMNYHF